MNFTTKIYKSFKPQDYEYYVAGGDIGGTNTRIGISGVKKDNFELLMSFNYKTQEFKNLHTILKHVEKTTKNIGFTIKRTCLGVAGPITKNREFCNLTNVKWNADRKKLNQQTKLKILPLYNDLETKAMALRHLNKKDILNINKIKPEQNGTKSIIAIGTGIGKSKIIFADKTIILPSESGSKEFSATDKEELKIIEKIKPPVKYEDIVSGKGIENLHKATTNKTLPAHKITCNRKKDKQCKETMQLFSKFLGRYTKSIALDDLPFGGIYLTGGVISENPDLINKEFYKEFQKTKTHQNLLKGVPLYVILTDDAGIIGACAKATYM